MKTSRAVAVVAFGASVTGAAVAAATMASRRRRQLASTSPIDSTSQTARTLELARLGTRAGVAEALHRARRAVVTDTAKRAELDETHALRTAEQVAETLGNLRGAMMKLGQMASYLDEGLPEPMRVALSQLQQAAPPMSSDLAAGVVESELGAPPSTVFASWDPVPIAAASIGQVHRAVTHDGREVAVKVQYPGVDDAIRSDLGTAGALFKGMSLLFPGLDPEPIVAELKVRLIEELDYRHEADNQRRFADWYRDHPFIHVPDVVDELSSGRVLTSELAAGARFDEMLTWPDVERNRCAEAVYRFVFRSIYQLHAFNGDPHPGNYLFEKSGRVTFLDFGLVKYFTPAETELFGGMIRAIVFDEDPHAFRRAVEEAGLLPSGLDLADEDVVDYFSAFYHLVRRREPVSVDADYASEMVRRTFDASGPYGPVMKAANVPPAFVIIQRINLGLMAVLAQMGATANWRNIAEELWPWVQGPPSTPMGEAEAAWLVEHAPVPWA